MRLLENIHLVREGVLNLAGRPSMPPASCLNGA